MKGRVLWALHAHLPYVRHPEHPHFFEEDWFFEALESCYLPLLDVFEGWVRDGIRARFVMSISPPLLAMWQDPVLQTRFRAYLDRRTALWFEERQRNNGDRKILAEYEARRVAQARATYERWDGDLVGAFALLAKKGLLELITTAGTHALLPLFAHRPDYIRAQIRAGIVAHTQAFGAPPVGFWLPECGWFEGVDEFLLDAGVRYTFLEGAGFARAKPLPHCGLWRPAASPKGLMLLGRDPVAARTIWSRDLGYPGDERYLDFHSDETWLLSSEEVDPFRLDSGHRVPLRLRYHRVTDRRSAPEDKELYVPERAFEAALEHADAFICEQSVALEAATASLGWPAVTVAPFDAELFGHWWREGPLFLDAMIRRTDHRFIWATGSDLLQQQEPVETIAPAVSTWGEHSDASVWLSSETAWIWPPILDAVEALARTSEKAMRGRPLIKRAHAQLAREVFLATSSDWPFLIRLKTASSYASERVRTHLHRCDQLVKMLEKGQIDPRRLEEWEQLNPIFPWMDYPMLSGLGHHDGRLC